MPNIPMPTFPIDGDFKDSMNYLAQVDRILQYLFENGLDSENIFEVGGWRLLPYQLISKDNDVGMSTDDDGVDPVRFFASPVGDVWLWYVTKGGLMVAQNASIKGTIEALSGHIGGFTIEADKLSSDSGAGIIQGGTVRTGAPGVARVEMKDNSVQTFNSDDHLQGPVWGETNPSATYGDFSLYDDGVEVIRFENQLAGNGYLIKSVGAISSLRLGGVGRNTQATGSWHFFGDVTFDMDINGKISEAYFADHAATASAADELSPSGEIAWGQVLKTGSDLADLQTKNLSSLTQNSSNRTVTDTEKATWNAKASSEQESWSAATLQNSWVNLGGTYATAGYYKDQVGTVHLKGVIKSGTASDGTTILILPTGYRPSEDLIISTISSTASAIQVSRLDIMMDGRVIIYNAANNFFSINNIHFRAS